MALRYLLVFAVPLLASILLFYGSFSLRSEARNISYEWLDLAISENIQDRNTALEVFGNEDHMKIYRNIKKLAISTVLITSFLCALIIPTDFSAERKLNLLTAMVVGLCAAKIVFGFGHLNWFEFGKVTSAGSVLAGSIVWLRSAVMHEPSH